MLQIIRPDHFKTFQPQYFQATLTILSVALFCSPNNPTEKPNLTRSHHSRRYSTSSFSFE
jgi:hypothetical protein